jgi:cholesterol 7-desaturase
MWGVIFITICTIISTYLFRLFFKPYNNIRHLNNTQLSLAMNPILRKRGALPQPYPNSWFRLLFSHEVKQNEIKSVNCLGQHLIVFRDKQNKIKCLDAYCPHLGADLSQGKIVDSCVECPFHGWRFDENGKCAHIPYCQNIPDIAKIKTWHVIEVSGMILLWHHADSPIPLWEAPLIADNKDNINYIFHGSSEHHVTAHIQEIPENGPDTAHLNFIHKPFMYSWVPLINHQWDATWIPGENENKHLAFMQVKQCMKIFNRIIPTTTINVSITQIGPGLVQLCFSTIFGKLIIVESVTPIAPLLQKIGHVVYAEKKLPRFMAKFLLHGLTLQLERDILIWNKKQYLNKPLVVKTDGPILQYRRWIQQFYSTNSLKIDEISW